MKYGQVANAGKLDLSATCNSRIIVLPAVAAAVLGAAACAAMVRNAERGQRTVVIRSVSRGPGVIA